MKSSSIHFKLWQIALPLLFSNISSPLVGMVDTAVIGHLDQSYYLGGIAIGTAIMAMLYWLSGFLRMTITGLTAQVTDKPEQLLTALIPSLIMGLLIALLLLVFQLPIIELGISLAEASEQVSIYATKYLSYRFWGAPAVMTTLVLSGFLLGARQAKKVMMLVLCANLINLVLDIVLVVYLGMDVEGVAIATLVAEYCSAALAIYWTLGLCKDKLKNVTIQWSNYLNRENFSALLKLNSDMFLRALILQLTLLFVTFQAAKLGDDVIAANAVLMQFFILIALGLDAIAHGAEVLVGEGKGKQSRSAVSLAIKVSLYWSSLFSLFYSLLFFAAGEQIINLITDIASVREVAYQYIFIMTLLPVIAHWCFLFDGVFIGLTRAKDMRNTMLFASLLVFFPSWFLLQGLGYIGLWSAFMLFLAGRGISQGILLIYYQKNDLLVR